MDTGLGKSVEIGADVFDEAEEKNMSGIFKVGEVLEIRGSKFRIHNINKFGMKLRILKKGEEES